MIPTPALYPKRVSHILTQTMGPLKLAFEGEMQGGKGSWLQSAEAGGLKAGYPGLTHHQLKALTGCVCDLRLRTLLHKMKIMLSAIYWGHCDGQMRGPGSQ